MADDLIERVRLQRQLQARDQWLRSIGALGAMSDVSRGASVSSALAQHMPRYPTASEEAAAVADLRLKYMTEIGKVLDAKQKYDESRAAGEKEVIAAQKSALEKLMDTIRETYGSELQAQASTASARASALGSTYGDTLARSAPAPATSDKTRAAQTALTQAHAGFFSSPQNAASQSNLGALTPLWQDIAGQIQTQKMDASEVYALLYSLDAQAGLVGQPGSFVRTAIDMNPQQAATLLSGGQGGAPDPNLVAAITAIQGAHGTGIRAEVAKLADAAHLGNVTDDTMKAIRGTGVRTNPAVAEALAGLTAMAGTGRAYGDEEWFARISAAVSPLTQVDPNFAAIVKGPIRQIADDAPSSEDADQHAAQVAGAPPEQLDRLLDALYSQMDEIGNDFVNEDPAQERAAIMGSQGFREFMRSKGIQDPEYAWRLLKKMERRDYAATRQDDEAAAAAAGLPVPSVAGTLAETPAGAKAQHYEGPGEQEPDYDADDVYGDMENAGPAGAEGVDAALGGSGSSALGVPGEGPSEAGPLGAPDSRRDGTDASRQVPAFSAAGETAKVKAELAAQQPDDPYDLASLANRSKLGELRRLLGRQ